MDEQIATRRLSIGKAAALVLMAGLLTWQGMLAYFVYRVHRIFSELETSTKATVLVTEAPPLIWLFMLFTVLTIYDISKLGRFLLLNSIVLLSIVAVANIFLPTLVVLAGYAPVLELGNVLPG